MRDDVSESPAAAATERSPYRHWASDKLRFSDVDRQGHVNNAVFSTFFETGRVTAFHPNGQSIWGPDETIVVARLEIDFRGELHYPGTVDIGLRVLSVGRSSYRLGQAVFKGDDCVATAEVVSVLIDRATRKSKPLSPSHRAWLEAHRG